ncbi:MAG: glutathione peroxidase, partial [Myxococcota bacterium]
KTFCSTTYDVDFPMFSKVQVKGREKVALYDELTAATGGDEVRWNFTKFLVGRDGAVLRRFESRDDPMGADIVSAVEAAL